MGKERLVDKTMRPMTVGLTTVTPADVTTGKPGTLPIGNYKGVPAFFDLDKLANQPLVAAERLYAYDRIDARDIVTVTHPAAALLAATLRAVLGPVPAGEVWFLNRVLVNIPAQVGAEAIAQCNFRISSWAIPDIRTGTTPDVDGRSYWPANLGTAGIDAFIVDFPAQAELGEELRLIAGDYISLVTTITTAAVGAAALITTLTPFGRKGKLLVA